MYIYKLDNIQWQYLLYILFFSLNVEVNCGGCLCKSILLSLTVVCSGIHGSVALKLC